jgi:hypothetical protein
VKWCGDLTEIPTGDGKLYLAAVEDLFSRRLLGFAMSDRHDAELAVASLRMAAAVRGGTVAGVIFHTDQGSEYSSGLFGAACRSLGVVQSMGRVGSALDNAAAESSSPPSSTNCSPAASSPAGTKPGTSSPGGSTASTTGSDGTPPRECGHQSTTSLPLPPQRRQHDQPSTIPGEAQ